MNSNFENLYLIVKELRLSRKTMSTWKLFCLGTIKSNEGRLYHRNSGLILNGHFVFENMFLSMSSQLLYSVCRDWGE